MKRRLFVVRRGDLLATDRRWLTAVVCRFRRLPFSGRFETGIAVLEEADQQHDPDVVVDRNGRCVSGPFLDIQLMPERGCFTIPILEGSDL